MRVRERFVFVLFFASGAAGLVYEVVWSRLLKDVFGVTAYAVAAVLAAYLGGLALGSWAIGRAADRHRNPLRLYGLLEIGVAAAAVLGTFAIRFLDPIHVAAASRLAPDSAALACVRLLLASVVIVPATALMGGTLPAMTRAVVGALSRFGRELGFLYALNTAGAVAGSVAAGFFLVRTVGVHPTLWLAALLNLAVGVCALVLSRAAPAPAAPEPAPAAAPPAPGPAGLLLAVAASGVASLALEVLWTRVLVLAVGSSTHAFVTMISTFLVGIALGSFIVRSFLDRLADPRRAFGWVQAGIAASTLLAIPAMGWLVPAGQKWLLRVELHWFLVSLGRFGIAFLVLIVPTTLIGMSFPLAARARVRDVRSLGGELGAVYGALTAGNIAGAVAGGFVLLPLFGLQRAIALVTTFNLASAAWGLFPSAAGRRRLLRVAPVLAGFLACAGLVVLWKPAPFSSVEEGPQDQVLFYREGLVSTVKVIRRADDPRRQVMLVDAIRIGESRGGVDYKQQVLAHFPFLLEPAGAVRRVLTIGLGSGILAGEVMRHPGVERLDAVELSRSVIDGARQFAAFNGNALDNPAVHVIADDGINFMKRGGERYDVIISDGKSRIGQAGNAPFYSTEFYARVLEHLSGDGLFIQWTPLEDVPEDLRTTVRTFLAAFPHGYVFLGHASLFLVGRMKPIALDLDHMQDVLDAPATANLRRYGWGNAAEVPALLVADTRSAGPWLSAETTLNSLERPVLEFYSPRALATPVEARTAANVAALAQARQETLRHIRFAGPDAAQFEAASRAVGLWMEALQRLGDPAGAAEAATRLEKAAAESADAGVVRFAASNALLELGAVAAGRAEADRAAELYRAAIDAWPRNALAHFDLATLSADGGDAARAADEVRLSLVYNPDSSAAHALLGRILRRDDPENAIAHLRAASQLSPQLADVHYDLGDTLAAVGRAAEALREFREASRLQPRWVAPLAGAAVLLAAAPDEKMRNPEEAIRLAARARDLTSGRNDGVLEVLAAAYAASGRYEDAVETQLKAVNLLSASGNSTNAEAARNVLERYRSRLTVTARQ